MKRPWSIRLKLTSWYLGVLVAALTLFSGVVWVALGHHLMQSIEQTLANRTDGLVQFLELESLGSYLPAIREETREYSSGLPDGEVLRLYGPGGTLLYGSGDSEIPGLYFRRESVTVLGYSLVIELATPLDAVNDTLDSLRNILIYSIPGFILLAALGGWWISRRALEPVDRLTTTAESIGAGDLTARLDVPPTNDELERLGSAWNRMLDRIEQSVGKTQQLTADAAHELRTPVSVIRTASELAVRREREPAAYRAALQGIHEEAQRMSELVDQLLWLARNDASRTEYHFEDTSVIDVVAKVRGSIDALSRSRGVFVKIEVRVDDDARVYADPDAVQRLLLILVDNAVKFSPVGGSVVVRINGAGAFCRFEVEDDGPGVAPADLPRIFDRFYRGDRARGGAGSGLGLSIARAIVSRHKGRIQVSNLPGGGACFRVDIPLGATAATGEPRYAERKV